MATSVKASTSAKDTNRRRTITVRLPDELWQQLDEYCEKLLSKPHMMVAGLVSSYLQTMKKNGDLILPEFPSTSYKRWTPLPGTESFVIKQLSPSAKDTNRRRTITIRLPDELWQQLDEYCEKLLAKPPDTIRNL